MPKIYKHTCKICGLYYEGVGKYYCSKKCWGKSKVGKSSPASGKRWSEEAKEKIKGRISPTKGKRNPGAAKAKTGIKNPMWKGGISKLQDIIRNSNIYSNWRNQVFGRDNFTCQECGARGVWLEAHHIKPFSYLLQEFNIRTMDDAYHCVGLWDINNGITLCKECHKKEKYIIIKEE